MSDSLNNKELVLVGHDFAKALSSDTPIIDIAKMLSHLADRLDVTAAALRLALASLEAEPAPINDDMAYAFHHALSDSSLGADDVEEIKTGLRAAFANVTALPAPVSVPVEFLPDNLDRALTILGVALPISKEEFNLDVKRWMQRLINRVIRLESELTPPATVAPDYPETLPCPVLLEPGLKFGKGVPTKTMLGALQRRAGYYSELEAMTPEQRAEHEAGMKEFTALIQGKVEQPQNAQQNIPDNISDDWQQWISDVIEYLEAGLEADGELEAQGSIDAKRLLAEAQQLEGK